MKNGESRLTLSMNAYMEEDGEDGDETEGELAAQINHLLVDLRMPRRTISIGLDPKSIHF
jgi:hypothetical protein